MLVISATAGITRITEEHIGLLLALDMPFFAVINKCELVSNINAVVARLAQLLEPANKKPLLITDENMARNCVAPQKSILDTIDNVDEEIKKDEEVAVFPVSCLRGAGFNALHACLLALAPRRDLQRPEDVRARPHGVGIGKRLASGVKSMLHDGPEARPSASARQ
ncbi:GTP-binding protein 2-like [Nymphalis io]|uniref:GTP-binding protein 2-like n=1 Tax=Inachis io TaxID=171585 RepID=UPI00216A85E9|nr:GTP-binding protein 2-like [Nymphalis io]